ncbi:MAG: DUF3793 family protein [Clostridia bacterium]|nr:DUF3793 family protein [Clostridia bacterium]
MENIIAYHCAPALAGIKPANIVAFYKDKFPNICEEIERLNLELNCRGIYFEILCECDKRALIMVYRRKALEAALRNDEVNAFLLSHGYPEKGSINMYIEHLKKRLEKEEFPHEIGAFLGYPLHDIYGFINHKNEGCILCGEWKVYHNAEEAKKLFKRFDSCRKAVAKKVLGGQTLAQVFCAA